MRQLHSGHTGGENGAKKVGRGGVAAVVGKEPN